MTWGYWRGISSNQYRFTHTARYSINYPPDPSAGMIELNLPGMTRLPPMSCFIVPILPYLATRCSKYRPRITGVIVIVP